LANIEKQRLEQRENKLAEGGDKKQKKKSRGAIQREKKRKQKEALERGEAIEESKPSDETERRKPSKASVETKRKVKPVKPPKKKRKVDKEDQNFENLVDSYRKAFSGMPDPNKEDSGASSKAQSRPKREKRWFE
jgi:hypothetical protein